MDKLSIVKDYWKDYQLQRLDEAVKQRNQLILTFASLDEDKATVAVLRQSGIQWIADIDSKRSGKMYESKYSEHEYFGEIISVLRSNLEKNKILVIVGPGFTREHFINYAKEKEPQLFEKCFVHGTGYSDMNGIYEAIKTGIIEQITKENRVVLETGFVEKLFDEIKKDGLATYGEQEVKNALINGAVDRLLIIDVLIRKEIGEELLNLAKENKSEFTIINTMHEAGKKMEGIGGVGALLRFKI
jgi:protein pelota